MFQRQSTRKRDVFYGLKIPDSRNISTYNCKRKPFGMTMKRMKSREYRREVRKKTFANLPYIPAP